VGQPLKFDDIHCDRTRNQIEIVECVSAKSSQTVKRSAGSLCLQPRYLRRGMTLSGLASGQPHTRGFQPNITQNAPKSYSHVDL
jgi:hypothetical protein